jgi:hypothetical protein
MEMKTTYPDDVIRILVTEYLATCEGHIVLNAVETSGLDTTL